MRDYYNYAVQQTIMRRFKNFRDGRNGHRPAASRDAVVAGWLLDESFTNLLPHLRHGDVGNRDLRTQRSVA